MRMELYSDYASSGRPAGPPYAIMWAVAKYARYRILNPQALLQSTVIAPAALGSTNSSSSSSSKASAPAPINAIPTAAQKISPKPRPAAGWSEYYECFVHDNFTNDKKEVFRSMGWRMCKVGTLYEQNPPKQQYGVMQIFSYHASSGVASLLHGRQAIMRTGCVEDCRRIWGRRH